MIKKLKNNILILCLAAKLWTLGIWYRRNWTNKGNAVQAGQAEAQLRESSRLKY